MGCQSSTDRKIATLADGQHGVVARPQLLQAGVTAREIQRRREAGRLVPLYRGVYAVGHAALRREGRWMAAVLASGDGTVLSHQTAAAAWDLRRSEGAIHVTARLDRKAPRGIRLHRTRTLTAAEIREYRGIPVTSVERTIIDLSRTMSADDLEPIIDNADRRRIVDFAPLKAARSASLKAVLEAYDAAPTRSELERRFRRLCKRHGIPMPETNAIIEGYLVDFVWRERRLIVEVDGYRYHRAPSRFERDREQDVELGMKGWLTRRFTWLQLKHRAQWVAAAIG
jgi:very-short-patch-repair endonuclease